MREAIYNREKIKLKEYKSDMKNKLTCIYCGIPITHTAASIRQLGYNDIHVSAYFRLKNGKKFPHKDECSYIVENQLKIIYAECSNDEIMTKYNGKYIVRLNIITNSLEKLKSSVESSDKNKNARRFNLQQIKNGDKPAYISTIRKIMKLRSEVENESDLKNYLCLNFYNTKTHKYDDISWKYFFIEHDKITYEKAYNYIRKGVYHPMCFCGKAKSVEMPTEKFPWYKIKCALVKIEGNKYVSFEILFKDEVIYDTYKNIADKKLIVYGGEHYATEPRTSESKNNNFDNIYLNMSTKIYGINQIFILEE